MYHAGSQYLKTYSPKWKSKCLTRLSENSTSDT